MFIFAFCLVSASLLAQEKSSQTEPAKHTETEVASAEQPRLDASPPTSPEVLQHVLAAEVRIAGGDLAGAAVEYLEAALASDDPRIAERATRIAVAAGEWQMVALASDHWAMLEPGNLDARKLAAGSRLRQGDYVGAEYQLARILELAKNDRGQGWFIVTAMLAPVPDQARANKVLNNLLQDFDGKLNVDALFARSQFAARKGDLEQATELINKALEQEPERADLLAWSGRLAVNRKDEKLALKNYRKAWLINTDNVAVAMAYAELLKRHGDLSAAQVVLAKLPDTSEMRFTRIVFVLDTGDTASAEKLYKGFAAVQYKDSSTSAFHAAQSAELLHHPGEAIKWYQQVTGERAVAASLRQAFLFAGLGAVGEARRILAHMRTEAEPKVKSQSYQAEVRILQDAGRTDDALQLLNNVLAELPEDIPLRYTRALIAVGVGQLELGESDLRQVISVQPENAAALNALGYTLADLTDRLEEAEVLIQKAYALQPREISIIDSMGWISYRLGRLQEAEKFLRQAWSNSKNPEISAHLGEVLWSSGQKEEARSIWQAGTDRDKNNEVLRNTIQRFEE